MTAVIESQTQAAHRALRSGSRCADLLDVGTHVRLQSVVCALLVEFGASRSTGVDDGAGEGRHR